MRCYSGLVERRVIQEDSEEKMKRVSEVFFYSSITVLHKTK